MLGASPEAERGEEAPKVSGSHWKVKSWGAGHEPDTVRLGEARVHLGSPCAPVGTVMPSLGRWPCGRRPWAEMWVP